jgi:phosphoadenosine phosphosulfate reductase
MALTQLNLEGKNKVEVAIMRLQQFEPPEGYHLAFSGGKDSIVIYDLAIKAEVKFDPHYNITGIDPPELVYFIREHYPSIIYEKPLMNIWKLIELKGLPRRNARFCCEYLKEHSGAGRIVVTGVRWQESWRRKRRRMFEICRWIKAKFFLHPIIDWTTSEVWEYIRTNELPYCSLYNEGFDRLGCVLCPMISASKSKRDMERWPKIAMAWFRACERHYLKYKDSESHQRWTSAEEMFEWWLNRKATKDEVDDCQHSMFI